MPIALSLQKRPQSSWRIVVNVLSGLRGVDLNGVLDRSAVGGVLHMVLDTFVGGIQWLAAFYDGYFSVSHVSAHYQPWWLNFFLHWSMLIELLIVLWAGRRAYRDWGASGLVLRAKG